MISVGRSRGQIPLPTAQWSVDACIQQGKTALYIAAAQPPDSCAVKTAKQETKRGENRSARPSGQSAAELWGVCTWLCSESVDEWRRARTKVYGHVYLRSCTHARLCRCKTCAQVGKGKLWRMLVPVHAWARSYTCACPLCMPLLVALTGLLFRPRAVPVVPKPKQRYLSCASKVSGSTDTLCTPQYAGAHARTHAPTHAHRRASCACTHGLAN